MFEVKVLGDKVLKKKSKRVDKIDDSIRNICALMITTMISKNAVGLAANQVGILKRIIIVSDQDSPKVMINPEIIEFSNETCNFEEGCLSIPNELIEIERSKIIKVKYRNLKGNPCYEKYDGLTARIIQHEVDHLDGITMDFRKK
jgi:peptide deformylase